MYVKRLNRNFELLDTPVAHKGIYGKNTNGDINIRENSLESIKLAILLNIPFEFDIHQTKDNIPVIYHDFDILLNNTKYNIRKYTLQEIREITKDELYIPTLEEIIDLNKEKKVPMMLDFKETSGIFLTKYRQNIINLLKDYDGEYAIEAFNPFFVLFMVRKLPNALRGQLICRGKSLIDNLNFKKNSNVGKAYEHIQSLICFISCADYIAMELHPSSKWNCKIQKTVLKKVDNLQDLIIEFTANATKKPVLGWTYTKVSDKFISPHLFRNYIFDTPTGCLEEYIEIYKSLLY